MAEDLERIAQLTTASLTEQAHFHLKALEDVVFRLEAENRCLRSHLAKEGINPASLGISTARDDKKPKLGKKIHAVYQAGTSRIVSTFGRHEPLTHEATMAYRYPGHTDGIWDVAALLESQSQLDMLATACADGVARVFFATSGQCMASYHGHAGSINSISLAAGSVISGQHGHNLVTSPNVSVCTGSGDKTAHVWRISADMRRPLMLTEDALAEASNRDVQKLETPEQRLIGHAGPVSAVTFVGNCSRVMTGSWDRKALLFDVETGSSFLKLTGHEGAITDVKSTPDGRLCASSSKDTTVRLWDLRNKGIKSMQVLQSHREAINGMAIVGTTLVTGSDDKTVKVWDMRKMQQPIVDINAQQPVNRVSLSPNGLTVAAPLDSQGVKLFNVNGAKCSRLPSRRNGDRHRRAVFCSTWLSADTLVTAGFDCQALKWTLSPSKSDSQTKSK